MQNAAWSRMVSEDRLHFLYFRKCVTTHCTIDNNHGRQETLTASDTTHDTNNTIFQVLFIEEKQSLPVNGEQDEPSILSTDPLSYDVGKRSGPALFPKIQMQFDTDQAELALKRNTAWSLCGVLNDDGLQLLGSWTFFKKLVSNVKSQ